MRTTTTRNTGRTGRTATTLAALALTLTACTTTPAATPVKEPTTTEMMATYDKVLVEIKNFVRVLQTPLRRDNANPIAYRLGLAHDDLVQAASNWEQAAEDWNVTANTPTDGKPSERTLATYNAALQLIIEDFRQVINAYYDCPLFEDPRPCVARNLTALDAPMRTHTADMFAASDRIEAEIINQLADREPR